MKIEKGKLYYGGDGLFKSDYDTEATRWSNVSNKIAVVCNSEKDWKYVKEKLPYLMINNTMKHNIQKYEGATLIGLDEEGGYCNLHYYIKHGFHIISIDQFKEFYPETESDDNVQNNGHKESSNKLNYELDFDFITQMSERMQTNKGKYEPYNWKKPIDIEDLKQALFRHVIEVMKGNYQDDGRLMGHLEAISCNAMMLNYQLKNKK